MQAIVLPQRNRGMLFIFATIFLDMMGASLLLPILPYITRQFSADTFTVGALAGVYSAAAFLAAPALGRLSDRLGRRPVLIASVFGSAVGYFLFGLGSGPGGALWILFAARVLDGVTGGNIATAMAYIADVTPPKDRARMFAFVGMAFGLGFVFGPVIAAALSGIRLAAPAFAAGALSLASCLFGFFFLPESLPAAQRDRSPIRAAEVNPLAVIAEMGRLPGLGLLLGAIAITFLAYSGLFSYTSVFLLDRFAASAQQSSLLFLIVGLFQMIGQGGIVYRLTPRFGERRIAMFGLLLQAITYPLFLLVPTVGFLYPLAVVSALGNSFTRPSLDTMVANSVEASQQGRAAGTTSALYSLASVVGPLAAGLAYSHISPASVFLAGGFLLGTSCLLVARMGARKTDPQRFPEARVP